MKNGRISTDFWNFVAEHVKLLKGRICRNGACSICVQQLKSVFKKKKEKRKAIEGFCSSHDGNVGETSPPSYKCFEDLSLKYFAKCTQYLAPLANRINSIFLGSGE